VIGFGSSSNLAAAYGIAVTATMTVTTILTFFVIRYRWRYSLLLCFVATGFFLVIDVGFLSANMLKLFHGGWFPLLLGAISVHDHADVEARTRTGVRESAKACDSAGGFSVIAVRFSTDAGAGHGDFPAWRIGWRAACDAAQSVAQQGLARARGVPDGAHEGSAVCAGAEDQVRVQTLGDECYQMNVYVRLQGFAGYSAGAGTGQGAGTGVRNDGDLVLHRTSDRRCASDARHGDCGANISSSRCRAMHAARPTIIKFRQTA
jgi:hypothetical protein